MAAKKERSLEEIVADVKEYEDAGSWRIVAQPGSFPSAHFVRYSERDQYNLLTDGEYKTEQRANLSLALLTRPTRLTYQERQQLLALLERNN